MAISNGYATLAEYKAYAIPDNTADATDDAVIEDFIEAASRDIDTATGRTFYARTETRKYDVPVGRELKFDDDLLTVTTLTNGDDNTIASTEYNLLPANVSPKYALKLKEGSTTVWANDSSSNTEQVIDVAGTWGWSATRPDDINVACMEIAKALYGRRTGKNMTSIAKVTSAGIVLLPQGTPDWVYQILSRYKRRT